MSAAIGILGGTFAPVHYGHLQLARAARDQLRLAEVRLIPAGRPPLRTAPAIAAARRLHWLRLAIAGERGLVADGRELSRPGTSYTVDTLAELRAEQPLVPLCLLLGQDKAPQLPSWHRWRELFALAHLVFFNRPGAADRYPEELAREVQGRRASDPQQLLAQPAGLCWRGEMPPADISSSAIRARLRRGDDVTGMVPPAVIADFNSTDIEAFAAHE